MVAIPSFYPSFSSSFSSNNSFVSVSVTPSFLLNAPVACLAPLYGSITPNSYSFSFFIANFLRKKNLAPALFTKSFSSLVFDFWQSRKFYYSKYFFVGLGYKMYVINNLLLIWVGLTHYTILPIPLTIKITAKRKRIFILSSSLDVLKTFLLKLRSVRRIDLYKGKGLLEVKSYKGIMRMKSGKKKQY